MDVPTRVHSFMRRAAGKKPWLAWLPLLGAGLAILLVGAHRPTLRALAATSKPGISQTVGQPAARTPPSIVLVLSDDQRWDTLWAMPTVQEALVAHGVTFTNSFVVNPLCCPSRASVLTGQYSHSTGVYLNSGAHGGYSAFHDATTIATVLHAHGYTTALIGKYLNGYGNAPSSHGYIPPGWDRWLAFSGGPRYYDYRLDDGKTVTYYGHEPSDYSTMVLSRAAVSFIRSAHRPFFLVLAPYAPYEPATPPPGYDSVFNHFVWWRPPSFNEKDLSDKPAYVRALPPLTKEQIKRAIRFGRQQLESALGVDNGVRAILTELEKRHMLTSTAIAYTSDNGVAWGEHPFIAARKLVPYEEPIRVPLVIRYDRLVHEQSSDNGHLVLNVDLASTFAALAGLKLPSADGRSLIPLLAGGDVPDWRHDFLIEHLSGPPQPSVPTYCALRTERYKYVLYQTGEEELYDLSRDPHELDNLAGTPAHQALQTSLNERLNVLCRPRPPGFTAFDH